MLKIIIHQSGGRSHINPVFRYPKPCFLCKHQTQYYQRCGTKRARRRNSYQNTCATKDDAVAKTGTIKEFDATKFDTGANGFITSARFGSASVLGIEDGDWTAYNNVDITDMNSMRFNMPVSRDGGTIEVSVGSVVGNILASKKLAAPQQSAAAGGFFGRGGQNISTQINTLGIAGQQTLVLVYLEEFDGAVGKKWQQIRENKDAYSLSKTTGAFTITSEKGDVSEASNNTKNILLQSANSDWVVETKTVGSHAVSQPENAGLQAYRDENNFVKLMLRAITKTTRQARGSRTAGNDRTLWWKKSASLNRWVP